RPSPHEKGGPLKFLMVGHDFFRKGGREVIRAFDEVRRRCGANLELTIVSELQPDGYATGTDAKNVDEVVALFRSRSSWITHHRNLPNERVLTLMQASHVGLLPSYAETFGYSVLEFQACGVPVVTTDIRAFPEINDDSSGWLIPVPKRANGEGCYRTVEERAAISEAIYKGLVDLLTDIAENPESVE